MRLCAQLRIPCQVPLKRKHFEGFMNWKGSVENIISSYETRGKVLSAIPIEKAPHILGLEWHITPKADHAHSALRQTASWTLQSRLVPGPSPIASAWPEPAGLQEYIIYICESIELPWRSDKESDTLNYQWALCTLSWYNIDLILMDYIFNTRIIFMGYVQCTWPPHPLPFSDPAGWLLLWLISTWQGWADLCSRFDKKNFIQRIFKPRLRKFQLRNSSITSSNRFL